MNEQELDAVLKDSLGYEMTHIDNNGFTERVLQSLPRRRPGAHRRTVILGAFGTLAAVAALALVPVSQSVSNAVVDVFTLPLAAQIPPLSSVVLVGLVVWGAVSVARSD